jgi:hypothetical protein
MEKIVETKTCLHCQAKFEITDKDLEFYEKVSPSYPSNSPKIGEESGSKYLIPTPQLCPDCRKQRRLSFLNQFKLYKNICNKCNKEIVSRVHPES